MLKSVFFVVSRLSQVYLCWLLFFIVINAAGFISQAEKAQHFVRHAGYGYNMVINSAFESLERDDEHLRTSSASLQSLMSKPEDALQNLVETQRRSQCRTHLQLAAVEKQFHKVMPLQEAQLSQKDCSMLCAIEYFAK